MFNPTEIPSLAAVLDTVLADIEIVPGKVTELEGRFFANFSILSGELAKLTADEVFLTYLKPAIEEIGQRIVEYADGAPLRTRALPLPGEGEKVVGFRCYKGRVPVNVYIMRRPTPDRHQFIIDTIVQRDRVEDAPDEGRYEIGCS
ncbi:MAG: hypothetical protein ACYS7Y_35265 [Planctomycetota bacterium]|jgi:hypothetical protein